MHRRAFTLIEILVVIAIIGVLSSVVLASLNVSRERGRIAAGKNFGAQLEHGLGDQAVGMWDFNECSGTAAIDGSGHAHTGTLLGGLAYSTDSPLASGCSLSFDGVNDYTILSSLAVPATTNDFTVSFWINPGSQYARFMTPDSHGIDQWVGYDATNQRIEVSITEIADVNSRARTSSVGSVPVGKWTHVAVSIRGLSLKIYVNGALNAQFTETIPIGAWTGSWTIGQRGNATGWYLGKLDGLRIYAGTI